MNNDIREMIDKINSLKQVVNENVILKDSDNEHLRYATSDGLAYADVERSLNGWHISMIESERKGGGSELINKIISDAKVNSIKKITLTTTEHSGWAFFNKLGFEEVGTNNDPYDIPMVIYI